MSYLFQIFGGHSLDVPALVQNNFIFLVCLSVCSLPHFPTEMRLSLDISSSRWTIFFKFSGDIPGMFLHLFKIISDFLYVCQSVHCLTSLLKIHYQWYLQYLMSYLSQSFWRYSYNVCTLVPNNFRFLICLSVCS